MRDLKSAQLALERAENSQDEMERSLWLAKAADFAVAREAVLVGGAAVNLHTGSYRPTDIDLCAYLDERDRNGLKQLGFRQIQGDHFTYTFRNGERWPVEFPESVVDGDVMRVVLESDVLLTVITTESLVLDRLRQATDGTGVTFDEAVRLCRAVRDSADWGLIEAKVHEQSNRSPHMGLANIYRRVKEKAL